AVVGASDGAWCVCRSDVSDVQLQKTLDYACGAGADCATIQQGGACFNPNTVRAHCSYAANSYFQRKGQSQQACDFSGTATLTNQDPSSGSGCAYPASSSAAGSSGSGSSTNTPATGTGSSTNTPATGTGSSTGSSSTTTVPGSTTPSTMTPTTTGTGSNGLGGGGVLGGLGPSGNTISTDASHAGPSEMGLMGPLLVLMLSIFMV
ncbi:PLASMODESMATA CALLOSE-BINDING PROTEIN 2-like, partial [Asparagus officinalis]|uniref:PLASMODESMATA CALLOSE-BINDING PROTEIN 2-like n=1 Tax=Asparagus officinalis TaxID=4686 RepID=UPI00098E1954